MLREGATMVRKQMAAIMAITSMELMNMKGSTSSAVKSAARRGSWFHPPTCHVAVGGGERAGVGVGTLAVV
jgi:hypothetical protein